MADCAASGVIGRVGLNLRSPTVVVSVGIVRPNQAVEHFERGVAARGDGVGGAVVTLAPGVVAQAFEQVAAAVAGGDDAALVIGVQVLEAVAGTAFQHGEGVAAGAQGVAPGGLPGLALFFQRAVQVKPGVVVPDGAGHAGNALDLPDALAVAVEHEVEAVAALLDVGELAVVAPGVVAATAAQSRRRITLRFRTWRACSKHSTIRRMAANETARQALAMQCNALRFDCILPRGTDYGLT